MLLAYHHRGLAVVGFEVDEAPSYSKPLQHDPKAIEQRFHVGFPIARDCCGAQNLFCVSEVPALYFVRRDGHMVKMSAEVPGLREVQRSVIGILKS